MPSIQSGSWQHVVLVSHLQHFRRKRTWMESKGLCSVRKRKRRLQQNVFCAIISFSVAGFTGASEYLCSSLFQFLTVGALHAVVSGYFSFTIRAQLLSVPGYALVRTSVYINQFREVSHKGQSSKSTSAQCW